ncbi:hypothetical protein DPMN_001620 [Dreissena polymorpha]|uniref:Uncharacterized protein n=1 Tax=Dreissena polymorpha TaxID=45954 RepID=A0A9D4RT79_DREPO|nr:hypothetical protein DPMN_001620 [Dreissena polymorpha]
MWKTVMFSCFSGTVIRRWRNISAENKCDIELALKANSIIVTNEQRSSVTITQELVGARDWALKISHKLYLLMFLKK